MKTIVLCGGEYIYGICNRAASIEDAIYLTAATNAHTRTHSTLWATKAKRHIVGIIQLNNTYTWSHTHDWAGWNSGNRISATRLVCLFVICDSWISWSKLFYCFGHRDGLLRQQIFFFFVRFVRFTVFRWKRNIRKLRKKISKSNWCYFDDVVFWDQKKAKTYPNEHVFR